MSEDKERRKKRCKNSIQGQYSRRGTVKFGREIPGTNQVFDVIVKKGLVRESYILFDIMFSKNIDLQDVKDFGVKVDVVRCKAKIKTAYIVGDREPQSLAKDKIGQLKGFGLPIDYLPWYEELE